jgi:fructose-1,6-bisphosphatase/inositol monophosphatase family enzyme
VVAKEAQQPVVWERIPDQQLAPLWRFAPVEEVRERILALNPGRDPRWLLATPAWSIQSYNQVNHPAVVGPMPAESRAIFSEQRGDRVQDMAFLMPGQGWRLPRLLLPYLDAIRIAIETERAINEDFLSNEDGYHAYITIDQKVVEPHRTQRRQGFHGDAFMTPENADLGRPTLTENTYLVCDRLPTEFKPGPFDISNVYPDIPACLAHFDELSAAQRTVTLPPYAVVRITPYDVHSPAVNHSDQALRRTFVKITFSRERFNRIGNAANPLHDYDSWFWVPRNPGIRNLRNVIVDWNRPDADQFLPVANPAQLSPAWSDLRVFWAFKKEGVRAEPARKGASLQTTVRGFAVSVNIAQDRDWLITTPHGDQYFLSDEKFRARYRPEPDERGLHLPTPEPLPMVRLTAPIRFRAPWGAMQYAPPGSVLVLKQNDLYAIHADSFARSYRTLGDDAEASPAVTEQLIETVRSAALHAAEILRTQRAEAVATAQRKKDGTPVTALDYQVQRLYVEALFANPLLAGRVYLVGEESFADAKISQAIIDQNRMAFGNAEFVVVVDPLDNTRGYVGTDTVNYATVAAVLRRGRPIYFLAIAPEGGDLYEARADRVTWNGGPVPAFQETLAAPPRLLAAGLHWVTPVDPLASILPERFQVTDRFGSFQLAVARMVRQEPSLPRQDGVLTAGFPYHETIPAAAILQLSGATTVRANGLGFFPIQWSDLAAINPHQLIAGTTPLVNAVRELRIQHPPR